MNNDSILHINSSSRYNESITRQLSQIVVKQLSKNQPELKVIERDLATGLPFIDEQWIAANFTPEEERTDKHKETLSFSDQLVSELQHAKHIVIASPIYNFNIPAVLKAWIDLVARARLTFKYTHKGPVGLLADKKVYLVIASGGVEIGSDTDSASRYLKQVLAFIGLTELTLIDASKVNLENTPEKPTTEEVINNLILTSEVN
ncbi:FMN-dependent NADH-azoreductase [Aliikangiella sp. IMCC44359]|uniref:FMN-dependent NADH-azoreductase n=1 Tax=Aliikangiella sp. IMCC44359 TaxID=3459125 RepID=UPI00403AD972